MAERQKDNPEVQRLDVPRDPPEGGATPDPSITGVQTTSATGGQISRGDGDKE